MKLSPYLEWLFRILATVLEELLKRVSPEIRLSIRKWIQELEKNAKETKNPWDDLFVALLKIVFGVES
jgi:nitrate reductase assembly molybdenum cofactor insertion protein NarJ